MRKILVIVSLLLAFSFLCSCSPDPASLITPSPGDKTSSPSVTATPSPSDPITITTPSPSPDETPEQPPSPSPTVDVSTLVEYTGPLHHVFYHFLIAFPDIAYKTSYGNDLDQVCVGPTEFWRSLEELYKNGYVLYDLNEYITVNDDGTVSKKPLMVPEGKKPLVMSFDDINYYSKNHGKGIADKIILDDNGDFAMYTVTEDGTELITYDNGIVPLLEKFCEEYPDFSPFGIKGLLAVTGYDGILGYRTQRDSPNREEEIEAVKPLVEALKASGWYFGSHSYSHFHTRSVSLDRVKDDTSKWKNEVISIVGDTQIYVFPYGEYEKEHSDAKFRHLVNSGYRILCGVGMLPYFKAFKDYAFMDRQFIDGTSLRTMGKYLEPLMDRFYVYCAAERNNVPLER